MKRKARVLLWETCNRNCDGCCNKDWDLKSLPKVNLQGLKPYDEIILTGGEPMLYPSMVLVIAKGIKYKYPSKTLTLYTAKVDSLMWPAVMWAFDRLTVTLHDQSDLDTFMKWGCYSYEPRVISKRLNVFKNVHIDRKERATIERNKWKIRDGIEWIENCPLPKGEEFLRWTTI